MNDEAGPGSLDAKNGAENNAENNDSQRDNKSTGSHRAQLDALEAFATSKLALTDEHPDSFFHEAAVLKGNALGIIYDGDGSTDAEKVQRLLMLIPALLTVVDEARDTISRLRELEDDGKRPTISSTLRIENHGPDASSTS